MSHYFHLFVGFRSLAQKSAQASEEITRLVDGIGKKTELVSTRIDETGETSRDLAASTDNVNNIVNDFISLADTMTLSIATFAVEGFIQTVKLDHVVWKLDIYQHFCDENGKTKDKFVDHTKCRLGKWYYQGDGAHNHKHLKAFKDLENPHIDVHRFGIAALEHAEQKNMDAAFKALQDMENASSRVLDLLTRLDEEIQNGFKSISKTKSTQAIELF